MRVVLPLGFSIQDSMMIGPTLFTMTIVLLLALATCSTIGDGKSALFPHNQRTRQHIRRCAKLGGHCGPQRCLRPCTALRCAAEMRKAGKILADVEHRVLTRYQS